MVSRVRLGIAKMASFGGFGKVAASVVGRYSNVKIEVFDGDGLSELGRWIEM